MTTVRFTLAPGAIMPKRGSAGSSGYDLYAMEDAAMWHEETVTVQTGVSIELPPGWEAQVRPRSSLSAHGIVVPVGTIDADYRGPIGVVLVNAGGGYRAVKVGERIAQLVFARVEHPQLERVEQLEQTERGARGFGSTGR